MSSPRHEVVVLGGGIVGLATATALAERYGFAPLLLEAEPRVAEHQTGHNSGVIHSGLYYRPGSLKADQCARGREALYRYCLEHGIAHDRCGKVVVATRPEELTRLDELERRGRANGLDGLRRLDRAELREREPHVDGIAGLWVPQTGIVDYRAVSETLAAGLRARGAEVLTGARVRAVVRRSGGFVIETEAGEFEAGYVVGCCGLQADRVARLCGVEPDVRIVPFRGEYYKLRPECERLVRNLIYPVPDPRFPFLGVHFTRMIGGGVEAGPNAVLAFKREGYRRTAWSTRDMAETLGWPGFWRLAGRFGATGAAEMARSFSKGAFVRALQRLVPGIRPADVVPHGAGVRAQAVGRDGKLLDDFHILEAEGMLHVLNAPSPAATAALAIGETLADRAAARLGKSREVVVSATEVR